MEFRILYQDESLVAIDKPAGFQVHQPEDQRHRVSRSFDCLFQLRRQIDHYLYPVHRLDRATSGVLLFALSPEAAKNVSLQFYEQKTQKSYYCVTRGWLESAGTINYPLSSDHWTGDLSGGEKKEAITRFMRVAQIELPHAVGRYQTARYSLVRVEPQTGRMHQIRRHFSHLSHPLIGDTVYGDSAHNRFFREHYLLRALLLKAYALELAHPVSGAPLRIQSRWNPAWHVVFDLFGICPLG